MRAFSRIGWLSAVLVAACGPSVEVPDAASTPDAVAAEPDAHEVAAPDAGPWLVTGWTGGGPSQGVDIGPSLRFRGIPYAAPPLGELRFAPPAPVTPWTTPVDASGPGSKCFQSGSGEDYLGSEDCLHVNVWTPSLTGARPVMVFIHGGAFVAFSASDPLLDATRLAEDGDVVVVSMNYRLDVLGFLAHPALAGAGETTGNWGFLDQQAALRWVRANAAHFGGDPSNVTIFGESAGGVSVGLHLVAAGSEGLFERAISQSGPWIWNARTRAEAEATGESLVASLGCAGDVAACLRSAAPDALLGGLVWPSTPGSLFNRTGGILTRPTVDGVVFDVQPRDRLRAGTTEDVPVILGTNTDEGTFFHGAVIGMEVADEAEYRAALARTDSPGPDATHVDAIVA